VGVALVNGSGGRRKKEVRALYCPRPLVPAGVTSGTKGRGQLLPDGAVGSLPFVTVCNTNGN
jgi:hypothetical protein